MWVALVVLASALMPGDLSAQGVSPQSGRASGSGLELGQNFPNPFNPETRIPFSIGDGAGCSDPSRVYRVSLRIYNVLAQPVAVPVLQGGTGNVAGGEPIDKLFLTCGQYTASGCKDAKSQPEVASGVYLYRLEVDGKPLVKRCWYQNERQTLSRCALIFCQRVPGVVVWAPVTERNSLVVIRFSRPPYAVRYTHWQVAKVNQRLIICVQRTAYSGRQERIARSE